MNWFKRLCMFVFGLSGILALVALSLVWVGPWTTQARTLITENRYYFWVLEGLVCVSGLGLLGCMLAALFAPRNPKETIVADVAGGKITVTRTAIVKQTRHIIEADGTCAPVSVRVRVRKRGHIKVFARVRPHLPIDVVERGEILYAELEEGLAKVCGDSVQKISIVFTDPEQQGTLSTYVETEDEAQKRAEEEQQAAPAPEGPTVKSTISTHDIIVNMSSPDAPTVDSSAQEAAAEAAPEAEAEKTAEVEAEKSAEVEATVEPEAEPAPEPEAAPEPEPEATAELKTAAESEAAPESEPATASETAEEV